MALDHQSPEYRVFIKAVKKGQLEEVEQHLDAYPDFLDLPDIEGWMPLHFAAENEHNSMVRLLLDRGSTSIDSLTNAGSTPLYVATWDGNDSTIELLLNRGSMSLDLPNKSGWTPLYCAARNVHDSTVKLLLHHGSVSLDSPDNSGCTPLHCAARNGCYSTVASVAGPVGNCYYTGVAPL